MSAADKRFAFAENRWAYARWCDKQGVKQNHAVYVRLPERLAGVKLTKEQVTLIDGWERNRRFTALRDALREALK